MSYKKFKASLSNAGKEELLRQLYVQRERLEKAQQTASRKDLERLLLEMWLASGIKEIYKYKNRIKVYKREGLTRSELFYDLTYVLFADIVDIANYEEAEAEDYKVRVDELLEKRIEEGKSKGNSQPR